ncbi:conserved hypothetical protein [Trichinella spiralis]|uniref:hypothetical protein n=1 Tax=Trichinella spiralis TaxID=6334 RepID=UPI0001EFC1F2|nr:conserved hypothetical protein [Trichinella spiralis]
MACTKKIVLTIKGCGQQGYAFVCAKITIHSFRPPTNARNFFPPSFLVLQKVFTDVQVLSSSLLDCLPQRCSFSSTVGFMLSPNGSTTSPVTSNVPGEEQKMKPQKSSICTRIKLFFKNK